MSKKNSNQHSSIGTPSQFSTLFNKKMSLQNHPHNFFSTLMKPKETQSKHHHISCHQINNHLESNKLSTLNLSSKHIINNSIDTPDKFSSDKAVVRLKKENVDLLSKIKTQEKTIKDITSQKKKLEAKYESSEKKRRTMIDEIDNLKANETQLMTILYVLEEKGIKIEEIIDKWNLENEPSDINRSLDSAAFTPITLEKQPKCLTKIDNIPKLNFNSIKASSFRKLNADEEDNKNKKQRCNSQK